MNNDPIIIDPPAGYQYSREKCEQWIDNLEKMDQENSTVIGELFVAKKHLELLSDQGK